jgi:hypothetical protein
MASSVERENDPNRTSANLEVEAAGQELRGGAIQTLQLKMRNPPIRTGTSVAGNREAVDMFSLPMTIGNRKSSLPHYSPSFGDRAWWERQETATHLPAFSLR